jgi:hypothetical protein
MVHRPVKACQQTFPELVQQNRSSLEWQTGNISPCHCSQKHTSVLVQFLGMARRAALPQGLARASSCAGPTEQNLVESHTGRGLKAEAKKTQASCAGPTEQVLLGLAHREVMRLSKEHRAMVGARKTRGSGWSRQEHPDTYLLGMFELRL